ncbi:MAG: hypothetical protein AAF221_14630 [Pseudomonadota bacterium]
MADIGFSRRSFVGTAAGLAAAATSASAAADGHDAAAQTGEMLSKADGKWAPLRIVSPDDMDWKTGPKWDFKYLFQNEETGAHLILLSVPPGWEGGLNHYHDWHEWAYILSGDLTNDEFVSPHQHRGARFQFREGDFLSRPPRSLHGIEAGGLRSQIGCTLLIQEEGPSSTTYGVNPDHETYDERYKDVTRWNNPRLIDTIGDMRWDDMPGVPGVMVKYLMDNGNFKARLHWAKPGFEGGSVPMLAAPSYIPSGRVFRYVLFGDMTVHAFAQPGAEPEAFAVTKGALIDQSPKAIMALPKGKATERGCVWLQVEYGDERGVVSDKQIAMPIAV